jgi:hypothetical protein
MKGCGLTFMALRFNTNCYERSFFDRTLLDRTNAHGHTGTHTHTQYIRTINHQSVFYCINRINSNPPLNHVQEENVYLIAHSAY